MNYEDLSGLTYPHFTVIEPIYKEYKGKNKLYWMCKCECGNIFYSTKTNIKKEKIKSCGCYQKKYQREKHLGKGKISVGEIFGLLKVVDTKVGEDGKTQYICNCECGNTITLSGSHLVKRYSCGCMSRDYISDTNVKVESFTHLGKKSKRNTSGCPGVYWKREKNKWQARIYFNGKDKHLGYFDNKEEAIKARKEAENDLYSKYSDVIDKMPNKNNAFTEENNFSRKN